MASGSFPARYFDGAQAERQAVTVHLGAEALEVHGVAQTPLARWSYADIRLVPGSNRVIKRTGQLARVVLLKPEDLHSLEACCSALKKTEAHPGTWRKILLWGGGALGGMALLLMVVLPALANLLAPTIPVEREIAFGQMVTRYASAMMTEDGEEIAFCTNADGLAALEKLADRLTEHAPLPYDDLNMQVVRSPLVNAFAAPGGQVVVLSGLLDASDDPDELAGVLAHEFGHVAARDPTRLALRAAGSAGVLGLFFGDFSGGTVLLALVNQMMQASYTRDAEAAADQHALRALEGAGISSDGLANFFETMAEEVGPASDVGALLQSHPDLSERAAAARNAPQSANSTSPALSAQDWAALKAVCD